MATRFSLQNRCSVSGMKK